MEVRGMSLLLWLVLILFILWLVGYGGPYAYRGMPRYGYVHWIWVIILILLLLWLLGVR
jgi:hypothetical protein